MPEALQHLLPTIDGIIGFRPWRHLHWVVYQEKGLLWGCAVGKEPIHVLQLILFSSNNERVLRERTKCIYKLAENQDLKSHGSFKELVLYLVRVYENSSWKEEVLWFVLAWATAWGWHHLLSIMAMLSSRLQQCNTKRSFRVTDTQQHRGFSFSKTISGTQGSWVFCPLRPCPCWIVVKYPWTR